MRWLKHPSNFARSAAMYDLRDALGPAGYGAAWLVLERIAEAWDGNGEPELCLLLKEWHFSCDFSAKKFQTLLEIMENHHLIRAEITQNRLLLKAHILLELQDEWTSRQRKNSRVTPDPLPSDSGLQTDTEYKRIEKDRNTEPSAAVSMSLAATLSRHGIPMQSERARRIMRHIEVKKPHNPGGYLQGILSRNPNFDPAELDQYHEPPAHKPNSRQQGPAATRDILHRMGFGPPGADPAQTAQETPR